MERHAGLTPSGSRVPQVVVLSDHHLIAQGVVDLLPEGWRESARGGAGVDELEQAEHGSLSATVIDARAAEAERAAALTRSLGASLIILVDVGADTLPAALCQQADAILIRDEVDQRTLRLAFAAVRSGMRLIPRTLGCCTPEQQKKLAREPLREPDQRALELLAEGMRDAEIALALNLSESGVRKLIQRTVKRAGARTRCEAVAAAIRGGELL